MATWPAGVRPKIHFSSPKTAVEERKRKVGRRVERSLVLPQLRAHADLVDPIAFEHFVTETAAGLDVDVMLEAKAKDLALAPRHARPARSAPAFLPVPPASRHAAERAAEAVRRTPGRRRRGGLGTLVDPVSRRAYGESSA